MSKLQSILRSLTKERNAAQQQIERLEAAIESLGSLNHKPKATAGRRKRRKMSAAGRARIAAAQRARWAKLRRKAA